MSITEKISHAADRKAFETILDSMLKKGQTQDVGDLAQQLIDMIQKIHKGTWSDKSYETLRMVAENPDGKWAHYTQRLIRDNDPYILKTFLTNVAYEGGFRGYQTAQENAAKYDINVPWLILMDPTSACNMHGIRRYGTASIRCKWSPTRNTTNNAAAPLLLPPEARSPMRQKKMTALSRVPIRQ